MGWKWKSMGWSDGAAAWTHEKIAGRRASVAVRINGLPYSAHAAGRGKAARLDGLEEAGL